MAKFYIRMAKGPKQIDRYRQLILKRKIYEQVGYGIETVCTNPNIFQIQKICICFFNGKAIATCFIHEPMIWGCNISTYVKPDFRRRGIGERMVKKIMKGETREIGSCRNNYVQKSFYGKCLSNEE